MKIKYWFIVGIIVFVFGLTTGYLSAKMYRAEQIFTLQQANQIMQVQLSQTNQLLIQMVQDENTKQIFRRIGYVFPNSK